MQTHNAANNYQAGRRPALTYVKIVVVAVAIYSRSSCHLRFEQRLELCAQFADRQLSQIFSGFAGHSGTRGLVEHVA